METKIHTANEKTQSPIPIPRIIGIVITKLIFIIPILRNRILINGFIPNPPKEPPTMIPISITGKKLKDICSII